MGSKEKTGKKIEKVRAEGNGKRHQGERETAIDRNNIPLEHLDGVEEQGWGERGEGRDDWVGEEGEEEERRKKRFGAVEVRREVQTHGGWFCRRSRAVPSLRIYQHRTATKTDPSAWTQLHTC